MTPLASSGSFLITPNVGLMIWILVVFAISLFILTKYVYPQIAAALDRRQHGIEESIDAAEKTRQDAEQLLAEYRERLKDARAQSDEIVHRARETAQSHATEAEEQTRARTAELLERAQRDIESATARALAELRQEVAELTILATEKVTRKTLNDDDQRRLVEEAISELDFSSLSSASGSNN
jgi:F-type H+-transporting ATPase subunit b